MKKIAFLLVASLMPFMTINSDPIDIIRTSEQNHDGPRTTIPLIKAELETNFITISIYQHLGNAAIKINNEEGQTLIDNSTYIHSFTSFMICVSLLPDDSYTITIDLENGNTYEGHFDIVR